MSRHVARSRLARALLISLSLTGIMVARESVPRALSAQSPRIEAASDPVLVGAGDIADCATVTDSATAALLDGIDGTVFAAGDNAYLFGSAADYTNCYEPTWGRHKARTRPAPGNHEYLSTGAAPYFAYFGPHAGPAGRGYYSYNVGAWHIISLNSNIAVDPGSPQEQWLRADLAANQTLCTLAYWHHPYFSSGVHGNSVFMRPLFQALYDWGADVVVTGHDHDYEQFHRQNPDGIADANGIREFVVGTGGTELRAFDVIKPNSAARDSATHGVLKLTLHPTSYDWEFVPIAGETFTDVGSRPCVGTAPAPFGGRGFAIGGTSTGEDMFWTTGTAQTAYAVVRFAGGVATVLPGPTSFLPASATDFTDTGATAGQLTCYTLFPLGASGPPGRSDLLCTIPRSRSGSGAPANAHVQLDQTTMATLTWSPPGGQTGYALWTIPLDGTPQGVVTLPANATRAMHETSGRPTCYVLFGTNGPAITGNTDVLCAIPGQAALADSGSSATFGLSIDAVRGVVAGLRPPQGADMAALRMRTAATIASIEGSVTTRPGDDKH